MYIYDVSLFILEIKMFSALRHGMGVSLLSNQK